MQLCEFGEFRVFSSGSQFVILKELKKSSLRRELAGRVARAAVEGAVSAFALNKLAAASWAYSPVDGVVRFSFGCTQVFDMLLVAY